MTKSLVAELLTEGYTAYDQSVPEGAKLPYVWIGRSGGDSFNVLDADSRNYFTFVDLEVWGPPGSQLENSQTAVDLRELLSGKAGTFGDGVTADVAVLDQRDNYQYRNPEGEDRLVWSALRLRFLYYREG